MEQKPLYVNSTVSCDSVNYARAPVEMQVFIDSES